MNTTLCSCGKSMKFHDENSEERIELDLDELDGSFWYCDCGKIIKLRKERVYETNN
jgi:hypothetical protein